MKELLRESHKEILFIVKLNYNNIYARLRMLLGEDASVFADLRVKQTETIWYALDDGEYRCYDDATEDEREEISEELVRLKKDLGMKIGEATELAPHFEELWSIPDSSNIFFQKDKNGKIKIILTAWGCRKARQTYGSDIVAQIIRTGSEKHKEVKVVCYYPDKCLAAKQTFQVTYQNVTKEQTTDDEGSFIMGTLLVGSSFSILKEDTGESFTAMVDKEIDCYNFTFSMKVRVNVKVINQHEETVTGLSLTLDNSGLISKAVTNAEGAATFDGILYNEGHRNVQITSNGHSTASFSIGADKNDFIFKLNEKKFFQGNVKVLDSRNMPCAYEKLICKWNERELVINVDSNGTGHLPEMEDGTKFILIASGSSQHAIKYQFDCRQIDYVFHLTKDIVFEPVVHIIEAEGKEVPNYLVKMGLDGQEVNYVSDAFGNIRLPKMKLGSRFRITDTINAAISEEYMVNEEHSNTPFIFTIERTVEKMVSIRLIDEEKYPISQATLTLLSVGKECFKTTNTQGEAGFPSHLFIPGKKMAVRISVAGRNIKDVSLKFKPDCLNYTIRLKKPFPWKWLWLLPVLLVIVAGSYFLWNKYSKTPLSEQVKGVVMIRNICYYSIDLPEQSPLYFASLDDDMGLKKFSNDVNEAMMVSYGTGFFISSDGTIATNRHNVSSKYSENTLKDHVKKRLAYEKIEYTDSIATYKRALEKLIRYLNTHSEKESDYNEVVKVAKRTATEIGNFEATVRKIDIMIAANDFNVNYHADIGIAYANTIVEDLSDFVRCSNIKISEDPKADVATIQLKSKKTPDDVYIFKVPSDNPLKNITETDQYKVTMMGYNMGPLMSLTEDGMKIQVYSGTISQNTDKYQIMYSIPSEHGSSGSPVVNERGELVAINYAGYNGTQSFNLGIRVQYLKELLEKK